MSKVYLGDCLEIMPTIADKSVDMILCDLPYGTTACKWDTVIPFEPLWKQYKRVVKDKGAIVLTASQPFTSALVMSNIKMFKCEWIWDKVNKKTGFLNVKHHPLKVHENVLVFSRGSPTYNPVMGYGIAYKKTGTHDSKIYGNKGKQVGYNDGRRFPISIISVQGDDKQNGFLHPTQKPVALFEYLIKTYTNEEDLVLDNCAGSGTTGVACQNLKRNYILIEKEPKYYEIILQRLQTYSKQLVLGQ